MGKWLPLGDHRAGQDLTGCLKETIHGEEKARRTGDARGCIIPSRKREELPMSEETLRGWYWAGVIVLALASWVVWYMLV
jgi:hypothetical protein